MQNNRENEQKFLILPLTKGAISNGYITVPKNQSFFPKECIEDNNQPARQLFSILPPNKKQVDTKILANFRRIQARFNALFREYNLKEGDKLKLTQIEPYRYQMSFIINTERAEMPPTNMPITIMINNRPNPPLNQILYGPPGTGKTYKTIETAVHAAEPTFTWNTRDELKEKYDLLVNEERIRFVTFHQSFGYEEFVEGITPYISENDTICYSVESGVFKKACEDALLSTLPTNPLINKDGRVWKISIESTKKNKTKDYCLENNIIAIGWGETGDLNNEKNEFFNSRGKNDQNSLLYFSHNMEEGDIVVCINSRTSIEAIGVITGEYKYHQDGLPTTSDYRHQRSVQWLNQGFSLNLKPLNDHKAFNLPTCYPLDRMLVSDVLNYLRTNGIKIDDSSSEENKNYVIIIDEINRGNISKIFGELITLIEPSKRVGNDEALKLSLPYSGKPFSIPNNLYIIGTMNTADRSLTMLDTALRRRFDFIEMMPDATLLEHTLVKGIDLTELLSTLNKRIEVLYDREHTLGHAFFMPVKEVITSNSVAAEDIAFNTLIQVFQNKIIPLLQEYFFDDWRKIRLALGDNQKPENLQFTYEEKLSEQALNKLFGLHHGLNQYGDEQYRYILHGLSNAVWQNPQTYLSVYQSFSSPHPPTDDAPPAIEGVTA